MYHIGDCVVYPMHGAGIIENIETKEILGKMQSYYIMRIPIGNLKVMIPLANAEDIGIRDVIDRNAAQNVIKNFRNVKIDFVQNWNKRLRENMVRIKSGDIMEVAAVVKSLMLRERQKGLSTGEKKLLNNAKQIMISEIVVATGSHHTEIENELSVMIDEELSEQTK